VPFDKSVWGTPAQVHEKIYSKAANGATCAEYFPDGKWNVGGWSTYGKSTGDSRPVAFRRVWARTPDSR